jgi:tRNA (guanine-N7-)-methyltransferase
VASRLKPGARWHIATDWEPYAEEMLTVLGGCRELENAVPGGGYAEAPMSRSATRFERRGVGLGHRVRELLFIRR